MSLVFHEEGGITVARHSADERSVSEALKRFDPDLVLTWELDSQGRQVYEVRKIVGRDRPALLICQWLDDYGEPLPLSHALLDLVVRLRRGGSDPAERNRRMLETQEREAAEAAYEIAADMLPRIAGKRIPVLHRGVHLRRSRHKPGGRWST